MADALVQLHRAVDATVRALQPQLQLFPQPAAALPDGPSWRAGPAGNSLGDLTRLRNLLHNSDMHALAVLEQLRQAWAPADLAALEPLSLAIAQLDFALASTVCEALLSNGAGPRS